MKELSWSIIFAFGGGLFTFMSLQLIRDTWLEHELGQMFAFIILLCMSLYLVYYARFRKNKNE